MQLRTIVKNLLLAFVLITIGFALGRRTAPSPEEAESALGSPTDPGTSARNPVIVYAAHMTFRCPECNQIEWLARELIEGEFADALADGRLVFRSLDYMRDTAFAQRYNISSSTLVVTRADSEAFQRLDEVWTKLRNREEFFDYVRGAVREALGQEVDA